MSFFADYGPKGCRGGAESPLLASLSDNFAAKNSPLKGPDAPTPARIGTGRPMGHSIVSGGEPKGVQGGERKATLLASIGDNFAVKNSP